jgi:transposase
MTTMGHRREPLRPLVKEERQFLERIARSGRERADRVRRAKELLAVEAGGSYQQAARQAGGRSRDAVRHLVMRFNREGLAALDRRPGGGRKPVYTAVDRARILAEARRVPVPDQDGTATWSLMTLRRALRKAPEGLPRVSTYTVWRVLRDGGFRYLATRSWCDTGQVVRRRQRQFVKVTDPEAEGKKNPD